MSPIRSLQAFVLIAMLVSGGLTILPSGPIGTAYAEDDDIDELRAELNDTKAALTKAENLRDKYATRLEDQTGVLIIVTILLIISWFIFYITGRKQRVAFQELREKAGILPELNEQNRRARRRRG
jgi:hypothetical protein